MGEDIIEKKWKFKKYDAGKEDECLNDYHPDEIEECAGDRHDDNNGDNHEEKESECLVDTSPGVMEEDVSDKTQWKNEKDYGEKNWLPRWHFPWRDRGRYKW